MKMEKKKFFLLVFILLSVFKHLLIKAKLFHELGGFFLFSVTIILGSNFRDGNFDGFTGFEVLRI